MARKNRVSVYDGIYHVTARIANQAMLLAEDEVKDQIIEWIISVAAFSGVEVWSFAIMDNHLHLFIHVPPVPKRLWTNPDDEPCAYALGMRPPECRVSLWSSEVDDPPRARPPLGFMLDDGEMIERIVHLYGADRAKTIGRIWASMREHGYGDIVDREKARYCRRMYNLSQFVKTLKERVSMWFNAKYKHSGCLWQGRFYSGVVEKNAIAKAIVSAYIGYNPVKAKLVASPEDWRWSSYALAVNDENPLSSYCRKMYERMLGCSWDEVRQSLESIFADGLPKSVDLEDLKKRLDDYVSETKDCDCGDYRASQVIRVTLKAFSGAYIGFSRDFLDRIITYLPKNFPCAGKRSIVRCSAFRWVLPDTAPLKDAA